MKTPPVPPDLVEWLRLTYPPRCILPDESEVEARCYAAQVSLAQRLIRFGTRRDDPEGEYTLET